MKGKMLDLLLGQIFGGVGLQRHAVVAHALWSVRTHASIAFPGNLAILFVESVVEWRLLDHFPWLLYDLGGGTEGHRGGFAGFDGLAIQSRAA